MPRILYLLAACNLVIGTGAFGLAGILQPISDAMGVSVAVAGQSMTAYAFATALLAPVLLLATGSWSRKSVLQLGLLMFAAGTLVCALSTSLTALLLGRVLMGAGAVFTPVAASLAVALVAPERRGRALSLTFLGMSMSYVIGLPLTAWLGLLVGWQWPLFSVAALGVVMLLLVSLTVRRDVAAPGASFAGLGALLRHREVLRTLLMTLMYFNAIFTVFSYIGPVLQAMVPMGNGQLSLTLMLFGVAGVMGTLSGGWATDRFGALPTLKLQLAVLAATMLLVPLTAGWYWPMVAVFMVWGVAGFGMMTPQQSRLASAAPAQTPILLSLNASMLYFGTAIGAGVGGPVSSAFGFVYLPWLGAFFALLGALTLMGRKNISHMPDTTHNHPHTQLAALSQALAQLRDGAITVSRFSDLARAQDTLIGALPPRYGEVLLQLLDRLESSALFSEESCSFSQKELFDSLQMWLDKAKTVLPGA